MNRQKTATILEDPKINIKIKLSGLWASVLFLFIYVDYFGLYIPGVMEKIIEGEVAHTGIQITQVFFVGSYNINDDSESYDFPVPGIEG